MKTNKETTRKTKHNLITYFLICTAIAIYYFFVLDINFIRVILRAFTVFFIGTTYFNSQQLGSLVLTSSIVGLGVIVSVCTILFVNNNRKINFLSNGWMMPTMSFIYAIVFSIIKILIGAENIDYLTYGVTQDIIQGIGHLAFVYFILGLATLIIWFIVILINGITKNEQ